MKRALSRLIVLASIGAFVSGCGSSNSSDVPDQQRFAPPPTINGSNNGGGILTTPETSYQKGIYRPPSQYVNYCENPRSGVNPHNNNEPYPDKLGSLTHELHFLRSWSHESYYWADDLPDLNPNIFTDRADYYSRLKTEEVTANNEPLDKHHYFNEELSSDKFTFSGKIGGYGLHLVLTAGSQEAYVRFVDEGSPANLAGIQRGMKLTGFNGISLPPENESDRIAANNVIFNPQLDATHSLEFTRIDGGVVSRQLTAENVVAHPVNAVEVLQTSAGKVGYISLNTFNSVLAERELVEAISTLSPENVTDLILDLRYNTGGLIYIAAQLGYMIAGNAATDGEVFGSARFNEKRSDEQVFYPFYSMSSSLFEYEGTFPSLDLNRVYVITTAETCSASEMLINALRGIGINVVQIGERTCGKPYMFEPARNCGLIYHSINALIENAQGFANYIEGFKPVNVGAPLSNEITGCAAKDELSRPLGAASEEMVATALTHIATGACPSVSSLQNKPSFKLTVGTGTAYPSHPPIARNTF